LETSFISDSLSSPEVNFLLYIFFQYRQPKKLKAPATSNEPKTINTIAQAGRDPSLLGSLSGIISGSGILGKN
jgi:hypothetical protein